MSSSALIGATPDSEHDSVVAIVEDDSLCTGVATGPRIVVTAAHCVDADPAVVPGELVEGRDPISVASIDIDADLDVAWLTLDDDLAHFAAPTPDVRLDDLYTAVGYGRDSAGESGVRRALEGQRVVCVGPACGAADLVVREGQFVGSGGPCPGDSGGPAVAADGRILGIVVEADEACSASLYSVLREAPEATTPEDRGGCAGERGALLLVVVPVARRRLGVDGITKRCVSPARRRTSR